MPNPNFPALAYVGIYSYTETPEDRSIASDMEDGSVVSRAKFTRSRLTVKINYTMTIAEKTALMIFYRTTVAGGAIPCVWVHPDPDSEFYNQSFNMRIAEPPDFQKEYGWWRVSLTLQEA